MKKKFPFLHYRKELETENSGEEDEMRGANDVVQDMRGNETDSGVGSLESNRCPYCNIGFYIVIKI